MFLCNKCHDSKKHMDLFRSRGRCEGCGKVADCIDCHYAKCYTPKVTVAKEAKKLNMSNKLSLETRASSAFVLGELEELIRAHRTCIAQDDCALQVELEEVLRKWKQAEAELAEARAELTANNEKESK